MKKIIVAAIAISLLFSILFHYFLKYIPIAQPAFTTSILQGNVLVIDAGHGGEDGGAVSISGIPESVINLEIAKRFDFIAGFCGIPTIMLRTDDISLHNKDAKTLRQKKVSDLHNRVDIINSINNAILISIHQNSFSNPKYSGTQVFFAPTEGSKPMAEYIQEILCQSLNQSNHRTATRISESIYLMNHINCPGILVECGFLSNPVEDQLLQTPSYQLMVALSLISSYLMYQNNIL